MPSTGFRDAVTDGVAVRSPPAGMRALELLPRVVRKRAQDENWHELVLAWQCAVDLFRARAARTKRAVLTALGTPGTGVGTSAWGRRCDRRRNCCYRHAPTCATLLRIGWHRFLPGHQYPLWLSSRASRDAVPPRPASHLAAQPLGPLGVTTGAFRKGPNARDMQRYPLLLFTSCGDTCLANVPAVSVFLPSAQLGQCIQRQEPCKSHAAGRGIPCRIA
jgi:hypothetical protein